jgi:hypothetical protein
MDTPAGRDLRHYSPEAVIQAAQRLRVSLAAGLADPASAEAWLQFRDEAGQVWCHGLRTGNWYRHSAGTWVSGGEPAAGLEGRAELIGLLPAAKAVESPVPEEQAATRVGGQAGLAAVANLLNDLRSAYSAGSLTSAEATGLMEELTLVEPDGTAWAPGFQTGSWYAFRQAGWERTSAAPDPQRFSAPVTAELAQAVLGRLAANPLPEPVAVAWRPVEGYPELLRCPNCQALQTSDQEVCWNCGQPAPVASAAGAAGSSAAPGFAVAAGAAGPLAEPAGALAEPAGDAPDPAKATAEAPRSPSRPTWQLVVVDGSAARPTYEIGKALTLGREADNQVQLAGERTSRHHARIERMGEGFRLLDLGSSNGTFLNGNRIAGPVVLSPGDRIQIGDALFEVQVLVGRCVNCGARLAAGARYCGECGNPVAGEPASSDRTAIAQPGAGLAAAGPRPGRSAGSNVVPAPGAGSGPRAKRGPLRWIGIGCLVLLALLASLAACGFLLNLMERV